MTSGNGFFFVNHNYGNDLAGCSYNIGNKYIQHAIFLLLLGHIPDEFEGISNVWDLSPDLIIPLADYINTKFKVEVWNLQDQIRPSICYYDASDTDRIFGNVNSLLSKLTIPVLAIGLGINWFKGIDTFDRIIDELTPNCKEFVRILSSKTRCIGIRGHLTKSVRERLGVNNTIIIGCPTMHLEKLSWQRRRCDDRIRVLTNIKSIISDDRKGLEFSVMNQDSTDDLHKLAGRTDVRAYPTLLDMSDWDNLTREHVSVVAHGCTRRSWLLTRVCLPCATTETCVRSKC